MTHPGKREGLARKVDTAAQEAERLGLTTATLILRMARLALTGPIPTQLKVCQGTTRAASRTECQKTPPAAEQRQIQGRLRCRVCPLACIG